MSGELRLANSGVAPLVTSLAALAEAVPIGEFADIGGLAAPPDTYWTVGWRHDDGLVC